ncbi:MAG: hypothetical protein WBI07_13475 [Mobilitalea sp.]
MKKELVNTQVEKEITIEEMIENINMEAHINGTTLLKITEDFKKKGTSVSLVRTIEIETEDIKNDEIIMFMDSDLVIDTNNLVVNGFLRSSVIKVTKSHSDIEDLDSYKLYFKDGIVKILPIIW